ncbi:hypothetical protein EMB92_06180 [Bifidobacterium callitrichos]|uniref:Uncharacterized protein n=1 Tax=Bifidobacterium callitrichos TaxID=762209 RepID=A0A5M9ZCN2_9BIFI|nr:hypothetical protein [Bifidobacterium callitrichos]KAA8816488.1 hypothetical protein EMB92_06180 [Bifidobacterium callitrichos]
MPTISAGALKRMLHLPANVVIGTPRIERDHAGREIVVVPVRPYARDTRAGVPNAAGMAGRMTVCPRDDGGISTSAARGFSWSTRHGA